MFTKLARIWVLNHLLFLGSCFSEAFQLSHEVKIEIFIGVLDNSHDMSRSHSTKDMIVIPISAFEPEETTPWAKSENFLCGTVPQCTTMYHMPLHVFFSVFIHFTWENLIDLTGKQGRCYFADLKLSARDQKASHRRRGTVGTSEVHCSYGVVDTDFLDL